MKLKAVSTIILMLLTVGIGAFSSSILSARAAAQVNILTHSGWLDSTGYYHVSGEVQNVGDSAAGFVEIIAIFYDSVGTVVGTGSSYTMLDILLPGRKSPFELLLFDATQSAKVDHYSLNVTFSPTSSVPIGLQIPSNSTYTDIVGYMHVVGAIKNIETSTATFVKVIATFYNSAGTVVAAASAYSNPSDLNPGQVAPFEILLSDTRAPLVDSYALTAQSQQYAIVPEFPSILILPLFMFLTMLAVSAGKRFLERRAIIWKIASP